MSVFFRVTLLLFIPFVTVIGEDEANRVKTFDQLFSLGVDAYNNEKWFQCASSIQAALADYKFYKQTLINCRLQCKRTTTIRELTPEMVEFSVLEKFVENSDCVRRCNRDMFGDRIYPEPWEKIQKSFLQRKPYEYLQFCLFQVDKKKEAASAAYTFYLANPDNEDMISNVRYYKDNVGIAESDFLDMEMRPYKEYYIQALSAYNEENWADVIENMEKAVSEFLLEEERCQADCESTYEHVAPQEFVSAVADHYLSVLTCQHKCEDRLSVVFSEKTPDFLADHFHYLHYAYYKLDNIEKSAEAAGTFLLLKPGDEIMKKNKDYFLKKGCKKVQFKPREVIMEHVARIQQVERILQYGEENYMRDAREDEKFGKDEDEEQVEEEETEPEHWMKPFERLGLKIIGNEKSLKGSLRFAVDGFLRTEQCQELLFLIEGKAANKNGATVLTINDAKEMVNDKDEEYEVALRLLIRVSESNRVYAMRYYNQTNLFFKRTRVVCWEQIEDEDSRNCIPQEFGLCRKDFTTEKSRGDFMTVLYLSDIEEGANLYFLNDNKTAVSKLDSKCGRLAGFRSLDTHGVHIPKDKKRCALVIKYTSDPSKDEVAYIQTIQAIQQREEERNKEMYASTANAIEDMKKKGAKVVKNGTDLKGGERFVADGLASEEECVTLQNLVMTGALVGDGYEHLPEKPSIISPHTEHEMFQGLSVFRAAQLANSELVSSMAAKLFLDLSEKSRMYVADYFNLSKPLYFDFTHLVCRTALDEKVFNRSDLSHPVHADNCMLKPDGSCPREFPAYVQRDYSAILYLNDNFEGGDFFFAHPNKTEQISLKPKCGRIVGFSAGEFHGVKAVLKGQRCALALWFTMNPHFKELAHLQARKIIHKKEKEDEKQKHSSDEL